MEKTDFTINGQPGSLSISFECPFCENDVTTGWDNSAFWEYCLHSWFRVKCPHCKVTVLLGDYEVG